MPRPDINLAHLLGKYRDELTHDVCMDVQAIGYGAGLPAVAELCRQEPLDNGADVSICEHDEGALPSSSIDARVTWSATCRRRTPPAAVEPVKDSLRILPSARSPETSGAGASVDAHHPVGQPRLLEQRCREWCFLRRLDNAGTDGGYRWSDPTRHHGDREVPWCDEQTRCGGRKPVPTG